MKKFSSMVIAIVLIVAMVMPGFAFALADKVIPVKGELDGQIVILHTNDSHGRVDAYLGFTAVAYLREYYSQQGATVFVFDAGDTFHGLPIANLFEGASVVDIMETVGYDAMSPGNHDFNYGYERLMELDELSGFDVLAANITYKDSGEELFDCCSMIERNGVKLGVFGLTTPDTEYKTHPDNVAGITFGTEEEIIATANACVDELNAQGADYIVCVAHFGLDDSSIVNTRDVLEVVDGIDVWIDGHSHTTLETGLLIGDTLVASTGEYIEKVGVVTIDGQNITATLSAPAEGEVFANAAVDELIADYNSQVEEICSEVVAYTDVMLNGEREFVRKEETNLGDLAADAIISATGADIAIINGGGIRCTLPIGDITLGQLLAVFPFGNYVKEIAVTGQQVHDMLENGVSAYPELAGRFPQISGVTFKFDPSADALDRVDVADILVAGEPLDMDAVYTVATNDYLAAGGDGYTMLGEGELIMEHGTLDTIFADYLVSYYDTHGTLEAYTAPLGRIVVKTEQPLPPVTGAFALTSVAIMFIISGAAVSLFKKN